MKAQRIAIVGSGPSGFFAAAELLKADPSIQIDFFERLHAPFGLVRYGVAPDHFKTRGADRAFTRTLEDPRVRWFGNVHIGRDLEVETLQACYPAVLFTTGMCGSRKMGIPGEELPGVVPAVDFVGWYNGHPDFAAREIRLDHPTAIVVGNGNVAIDLARILARDPEELHGTDMAEHAVEALRRSKVEKVYVLGRRGAVQSSFTPKELGELAELAGVWPTVDPAQLQLDEPDRMELEAAPPQKKKVFEHYLRFAENHGRPAPGTRCEIAFRFCKSPLKIHGETRVEAMTIGVNRLDGCAGSRTAVTCGEEQTLECGLVLPSIGYANTPIEGLDMDPKSGIIPNESGRVNGMPGVYVAGWVKRGPRGLIGNNKPDATETVQQILEDLPGQEREDTDIESLLKDRNIPFLTRTDWQEIDAVELQRGSEAGKLRQKTLRWPEVESGDPFSRFRA